MPVDADIRDRVRRLAAGGFTQEPEAAAAILREPWRHVFGWLEADLPTTGALRSLLFHLKALSQDRFFARNAGVSFTAADYDALVRQVAGCLADDLLAHVARNRAIESLFNRDYDRGFDFLDEPREVARLLGLLQLVESHLPWPEASVAPELGPALETALAPFDDEAFERDPEGSARLTARVLRVLVQVWAGARCTVQVPLAGAHPGVVRLTVSCAFSPEKGAGDKPPQKEAGADKPADPARPLDLPRRMRKLPVEWGGLPVGHDVRDGMPGLLARLAELAPEAASALSKVTVVVSEVRHRPLDRAVRLMAGRSWELGGMIALLAAVSGVPPGRVAATGQVDAETGRIEAVGGIEDKVEALAACRPPDDGPVIDTLFCAAPNTGAAERAMRRLNVPLELHGLTADDELLAISGPDPWRAYCEELVARADRQRGSAPVPEWLFEGQGRLLGAEERVVITPGPFGVDVEAWCMQLAGALARSRLERVDAAPADAMPDRSGVPVVLPADPDAPTMLALISDGVQAIDSRIGDVPVSNTWQSPDGFVLLHADPSGVSPLLLPASRELLLSRRHPAMRHRLVFVARDLHQLEEWRGNAVLGRL